MLQFKNPMDIKSLVINSDRVKLVPISHEYTEVIFAEFTDEITRFMVPATPANIDEITVFIQTSIAKMDNQSELILAILSQEDASFLGVCGLHGNPEPDRPILGIWLKKSAHGNKFGQETIRALVAWARNNIDYEYLMYPCDKDNIPSRKIAEYLNGVVIRQGQVTSMSGKVLNEVTYKII